MARQRRFGFGPFGPALRRGQLRLHRVQVVDGFALRLLGAGEPIGERRGLGFEPGADLGLRHRRVAGLAARRHQFAAQRFGRAIALLARSTFRIQFAQAPSLTGFGAFLREGHLLAGALELGRELGTQGEGRNQKIGRAHCI
ncbi:hypothetical protein D9M68_669890 [compost metagenome]